MNAQDAKAYVKRWQEVERIERAEAKNTSIQERWRQLNSLKSRASRLDIKRETDEGEMEVFLRWAALKSRYIHA